VTAHFRTLTGLRGVAALVVFISHAANSGFIPAVFGHGFGQVGVMLFFVLSGFLMAHLYIRSPFDWNHVARYGLARIARVVPLYLAVVLCSFLISNFVYPGFRYDMKELSTLLLAALFVVAGQELWTIPVEVQFYLLFLVFWYLFRRGWTLGKLAAFAACTVAPTVATAVVARKGYPVVSTYSYAFFVGAFSGILWDARLKPFLEAHRKVADRAGIVFLLLLFLNLPGLRTRLELTVAGHEFALTWMDPVTWVIVYGLFLGCLIQSASLRLLESRWLVGLGSVSYGFYLLHRPIMQLLVEHFGAGPEVLLAVAVAALALAFGSFRFFEKPAGARIRAWFPAPARPGD
jgi:peptidoglycan/LPS O-acetylase OafA/YrhL